jgi:hypothetical protein
MSPSFQSTRKITGIVTVLLALVALGWWLGGLGAGPNNQVVSAPPGNRATPRERTAEPRRGPPAAVQAALQAIRDETSPTERLRAAIDLANTLPVAEFADWLNGHWFDVREGPELMVFMALLTARWQHEDPAACAAWAMTHDPNLARTTLNAWATRDPQAALGFFQAHPDDRLELRTMITMTAGNPKLVLARLQEMLARGVAQEIGTPTSSENLLRELAMKAPALLTAALDSLPPAARQQAESALVGQRLATDFAGELTRLIAQPEGLKLFRANISGIDGVKDQLLARLEDLPPEWHKLIVTDPALVVDRHQPGKFWQTDLAAAGFTADEEKQLRTNALTYLAAAQPHQALAWLDDVEMSLAERNAVIEASIQFGANSPAELAAMFALLTTEEDRQAATRALKAPGVPALKTEIPTPDSWVTEVTTTDPTKTPTFGLKSELANMSREQLAELKSRFQTLPDEQKLQVARTLGGIRSTDVEPTLKGEAIRFLAAQPGDAKATEANLKMAAEHANQWAKSDPTAAGEWARTLPPGDTKLWAMRNLAVAWTRYDPAAAKQWVASLPAGDRDQVATFLTSAH